MEEYMRTYEVTFQFVDDRASQTETIQAEDIDELMSMLDDKTNPSKGDAMIVNGEAYARINYGGAAIKDVTDESGQFTNG
jgi:hypothetical protein